MLKEWPCTLLVLCEVACLLEDQDLPVSDKAGPLKMSTFFFVRECPHLIECFCWHTFPWEGSHGIVF